MAARCLRYEVRGWGRGEVWLDGRTVLAHELPTPPPEAAILPPGGVSPPERTIADGVSRAGDGFAPELIRRFRRHLSGEETDYGDVELDLSWCTPFQARLVHELRQVPWGEVVSYGELAALAGRPRAARAAGTFCAANRFSLLVPCHRVVAARGIGGYGTAGVRHKRRLLALEGLEL